MKYLLLSVIFILTSFTTLPKKGAITLSRNYKVENTFSGDTSSDESFYLIIAKNSKTKQCEIIPITNTNGELSQFKSVSFDKMPSVSSYHYNEGVLTLIVSTEGNKEDDSTVVDIDLTTGESYKSDSISGKYFKAVIIKKNSNLLVFSNKSSVNLIDVKDSKNRNNVTG
ncbi:hypothetical protein ES676_08275 [Bizionia saleffrena]|uniref:Uncharacterized protein n=1 Tax=Bizionia saleffrena TaxID=291189 RepID=A0A8H2LEX7_9FLAO|nr:hypothetical protein [Bizionia saleffrena]TYB74169.1 hypothetical protein ES676_08275 [Bizionia saleffrena]